MNVRVHNFISNMHNAVANKRIRERCERVHAVDSLSDFDGFAKAVREFKAQSVRSGDAMMWHGIANESLFYGHLKALCEYAGLTYDERLRFALPSIEHGVAWVTDSSAALSRPYVHNIISQGAYRKPLTHIKRPGIPHYVIGPYTCYAREWYGPDERARIKATLGRTALVFPAHSYEGSNVAFERRAFVNHVMEGLAPAFDTVLVSAYWHDADDEMFSLFSEAGARVVSAGLRSDPNFIARLKTMISLADVVVGNALGTHIGYALAAGKPFRMTSWDIPDVDDYASGYTKEQLAGMGAIEAQFRETFGTGEGASAAERDRLFATYWGGLEARKAPEDIRALIEISQDVFAASHGFTGRFAACARDVRESCGRSSSPADKRKAQLLDDALGVKGAC